MTPKPLPTAQAELIERVRRLLAAENVTREVSMFGGRAFMVDEKMVVSASRDGSLLVRVPAAEHETLVLRPGASQAEMGTGRTMGPGWISVADTALADDAELASWLEVALQYNRSVTAPSD